MVVYIQSLVKCFYDIGNYGLQLLNDLIKRNYSEHFLCNNPNQELQLKIQVLRNMFTYHLLENNYRTLNSSVQTTVQYCTAVAHIAIPFFLAILELNFLALLSSFMIPSGLISHSRKVKRPLHDTFVSRDRKKCCWSKIYE